jgi:hypothetical protein
MAADLEAIRARAAAATPGPWRWDGTMPPNAQVLLMSDAPGRPLVMGFKRLGTQGGQPEFATERDGDGWAGRMVPAIELAITDGRCHRPLLGIPNEDAEFIAHARQDVADLLAEIDRLHERLNPSPSTELAERPDEPAAEAHPIAAPEAWIVLKFKANLTTSFRSRRPTALEEIDEDRVLEAKVVQATNGEEAIQTVYREAIDGLDIAERENADGHYVASPLLRIETAQAVLVGEWKAEMQILAGGGA